MQNQNCCSEYVRQRHFLGLLLIVALVVLLRSEPKTPGTTTQVPDKIAVSTSVPGGYLMSNFRVLAVVSDPKSLYDIVIATERAKVEADGERNNDSACGSIYTQPNCYFFREPTYQVNSDQNTKMLAMWTSGSVAGFGGTKPYFVDANNMQFEVAGGDAGAGVYQTLNLNILSGKITVVKSKTIGG